MTRLFFGISAKKQKKNGQFKKQSFAPGLDRRTAGLKKYWFLSTRWPPAATEKEANIWTISVALKFLKIRRPLHLLTLADQKSSIFLLRRKIINLTRTWFAHSGKQPRLVRSKKMSEKCFLDGWRGSIRKCSILILKGEGSLHKFDLLSLPVLIVWNQLHRWRWFLLKESQQVRTKGQLFCKTLGHYLPNTDYEDQVWVLRASWWLGILKSSDLQSLVP